MPITPPLNLLADFYHFFSQRVWDAMQGLYDAFPIKIIIINIIVISRLKSSRL